MNEKIKPSIKWAIVDNIGIFNGTWNLRTEAIDEHCSAYGQSWKALRAKGHRAVRVKVSIVK